MRWFSLFNLIVIFGVATVRAEEMALSGPEPSVSQSPSEENPLTDFIEEALRKNPEILAAKARSEAAGGKISQAWNLKKPWVSYDVMIESLETRAGPQEQRFGVSQEIPFPAKLAFRRKAARLEALRVDHELFHAEQSVRSQVIDAYADLMAAQQIFEVLEEKRRLLEQTADILQAQYGVTGSGSTDPFKIETELAKLAEQILRITDRRVDAEARLNIMLNRQQAESWPRLSVPPLPDLRLDLKELKTLAFQYRHGLIVRKLLVQEQETQYALARMEYLPDVEIGFNYVQVGGGTTTRPNDGQDAWMIPVKVTLPLWGSQIRGKIREEGKLTDAALQDLSQAENMAVSDISQKYTHYQTARDRVAVYEKSWIPQSEQALIASLSGYRSGKINILDVLDNFRMVLEAKSGYWQGYADTLSAYGAMEQAVGIPFDEIGNPALDQHFGALHPMKGDYHEDEKE